jgi:hypothetical protein
VRLLSRLNKCLAGVRWGYPVHPLVGEMGVAFKGFSLVLSRTSILSPFFRIRFGSKGCPRAGSEALTTRPLQGETTRGPPCSRQRPRIAAMQYYCSSTCIVAFTAFAAFAR